MMDIIKDEKAKFSFSTLDIFKSYLYCTCCIPKKVLRQSIFGRKVLNYKLGNEIINKDLDIAKIV